MFTMMEFSYGSVKSTATHDTLRRVPTEGGKFKMRIEKMKCDHLVPEIIPEAPPSETSIIYDNGLIVVDLGNILTPTLTRHIPNTKWDADPDKIYTFMMIDVFNEDAGKDSQLVVKHWLIVNIPASNIDNGTIIAAYLSPAPKANTGLHKYTFLVYEQPNVINFDAEPTSAPLSASNRGNWNFTEFLWKYNIQKLVSGNYFKAKNDWYAQLEREKLGLPL